MRYMSVHGVPTDILTTDVDDIHSDRRRDAATLRKEKNHTWSLCHRYRMTADVAAGRCKPLNYGGTLFVLECTASPCRATGSVRNRIAKPVRALFGGRQVFQTGIASQCGNHQFGTHGKPNLHPAIVEGFAVKCRWYRRSPTHRTISSMEVNIFPEPRRSDGIGWRPPGTD